MEKQPELQCSRTWRQKKTEVDAFAGAVCELGVKYSVATPVNKTLYNIIKSIENSRSLKL